MEGAPYEVSDPNDDFSPMPSSGDFEMLSKPADVGRWNSWSLGNEEESGNTQTSAAQAVLNSMSLTIFDRLDVEEFWFALARDTEEEDEEESERPDREELYRFERPTGDNDGVTDDPFDRAEKTREHRTRIEKAQQGIRRGQRLRKAKALLLRRHFYSSLHPYSITDTPRAVAPFFHDVLSQVLLFLPQDLATLAAVRATCHSWNFFSNYLPHWSRYQVFCSAVATRHSGRRIFANPLDHFTGNLVGVVSGRGSKEEDDSGLSFFKQQQAVAFLMDLNVQILRLSPAFNESHVPFISPLEVQRHCFVDLQDRLRELQQWQQGSRSLQRFAYRLLRLSDLLVFWVAALLSLLLLWGASAHLLALTINDDVAATLATLVCCGWIFPLVIIGVLQQRLPVTMNISCRFHIRRYDMIVSHHQQQQTSANDGGGSDGEQSSITWVESLRFWLLGVALLIPLLLLPAPFMYLNSRELCVLQLQGSPVLKIESCSGAGDDRTGYGILDTGSPLFSSEASLQQGVNEIENETPSDPFERMGRSGGWEIMSSHNGSAGSKYSYVVWMGRLVESNSTSTRCLDYYNRTHDLQRLAVDLGQYEGESATGGSGIMQSRFITTVPYETDLEPSYTRHYQSDLGVDWYSHHGATATGRHQLVQLSRNEERLEEKYRALSAGKVTLSALTIFIGSTVVVGAFLHASHLKKIFIFGGGVFLVVLNPVLIFIIGVGCLATEEGRQAGSKQGGLDPATLETVFCTPGIVYQILN